MQGVLTIIQFLLLADMTQLGPLLMLIILRVPLQLKGVSNTSLLSKSPESCSNHKIVLLFEHVLVERTVGKRKVHLIQ
jgi:hypothetical protein